MDAPILYMHGAWLSPLSADVKRGTSYVCTHLIFQTEDGGASKQCVAKKVHVRSQLCYLVEFDEPLKECSSLFAHFFFVLIHSRPMPLLYAMPLPPTSLTNTHHMQHQCRNFLSIHAIPSKICLFQHCGLRYICQKNNI